MFLEGTLAGPGLQAVLGRTGPPSHTPSPTEESVPTPAFSEAPLRSMKAIKAPLCVSGEAGLGAARGAHKGPAAVCLQTGELSCAEGLKAVIVFN